ncbi:phosphogluconate dehydratase [Benzoatithermus flavus]|uniref:Phosphogluconate dehydratase n=1 Tax=Benzoatithermus flavus TaxID=3108223 RepID=A0ABU8XYJ9_9PROT
MPLHPVIADVTSRIRRRSEDSRSAYLGRLEAMATRGPRRAALACGNLAHAFAACGDEDKARLSRGDAPNIGIVTAYNDMLSAHQPYEDYPKILRAAARAAGGTAQVAGGVPAMCDGVTQGQVGMELSLMSRDVIAMATAVALSHDTFDAALLLGICDKIVPGLVIGALAFGHLPTVLVPAGPMPSGLPNAEKSRVRQLYAEGKLGKDALLEAEMKSYHAPGTCTFYGTANSNQMLMEIMGLHLPGAAFVNPGTPLRDALTRAAAERALQITAQGNAYTPIGRVLDERAFVNGIVGLMATGGSTNHTLHLVAMARAAGIRLTWDDFAAISDVTPLLARVYPNGLADVNQFEAAGGMAFIIGQLLDAGLVHDDVLTVAGEGGLHRYRERPRLEGERLVWKPGPAGSGDPLIVRPVAEPFAAEGGLKLLDGNLGRGVIKISAVKPQHRFVEAPAVVFESQEELLAAFKAGRLDRDHVAVVRFQGPKANGMPELHKLTPSLGVLQDRGFKVALVTDGRMSGASGKVPAAIHVTPEAAAGGPLAKVEDGDMIRLDAEAGTLEVLVDSAAWAARTPAVADLSGNDHGIGRELFAHLRRGIGEAENGASLLGDLAA